MTGNERVKKVIQWLVSQGIVENQKDLAKKIGYNSSTISHIISGVKNVSGKFVQNLCSLSDKVNPNYLLSDDPVMIGIGLFTSTLQGNKRASKKPQKN